ncbi:hypothetical protein [Spirosoma aerophilum]
MKAILLVFIILSSALVRAQYMPLGAMTMWADGYVVTLENDTLRGQIRVGSMVNDSPASIHIKNPDGTKTRIKGGDVRLMAQQLPAFAYATGSIPRQREMIVFERVPNPRHNGKPMLLERLTPIGGRIALYFDASGWKKTSEYTFGNFVFELDRQDLSYIVLKNGSESMLAKRGDIEAVHDQLFGDCPTLIRTYPTVTRRDWSRLGDMVLAYNEFCR